jgi:CheY-like chemotaxis protein
MPIINGVELIKKIRKIQPEIKIIAMSELESPASLTDIFPLNISSFIQKPFDSLTLLKEVAKALIS